MRTHLLSLGLLTAGLLPISQVYASNSDNPPIPTTTYLKQFNPSITSNGPPSLEESLSTVGDSVSDFFLRETIYRPTFTFAFDSFAAQPMLSPYVIARPEGLTHPIKPEDWTYAFRLDAHYYFGNDFDVGVNWASFNTKRKMHQQVHFRGTHGIVDGTAEVDSQLSSKINKLNAEFGKTFYSENAPFDIRLHAGISYGQIDTHRNTSAMVTFKDQEPFPLNSKNSSKFKGVGPRLGTDMTLGIGQTGLSLIANISGAALFGTNEWRQLAIDFIPDYPPFIDEKRRRSQTVWNIEGRTGLRYDIPIKETRLGIEAGYHVDHYFDADIDNLGNKQNIGFHGPYVSLRFTL